MSVIARTTEILEQLIAFPTVSADSNLELIDFVHAHLESLGARCTVTRSPDRATANLFATLGPPVDGGVVLSGHTDVVPVVGQPWSSDPFAARTDNGRIYGRGSCDMKGFIACALALAPRFAALELARPLHLAFTYDEETGCLGAPLMLAELGRSGPRPAAAIIGEPTGMQVVGGHKGCFEYTTEVRGLEGHASTPARAVNAVEYAVRYIHRLLALGAELEGRAPTASPFDPPHTTVSVGAIEGGIARNVVARECRFEWEMRPVVGADAAFVHTALDDYVQHTLLPEMRSRSAEAAITTETIAEVDGLEPLPDSPALALACALTGANTSGVVAFGTEAGLYQGAGIPAVLCGPGSIDQAHKPDEYVEIAQLEACLAMLGRLAEHLQGPVA